jgi:transcriptional antiterminator NusG
MYWYVLFVKSGKERKVEEFLSKQLNEEISLPFIPLQEILFRKAGILKREIKLLFPGYVFISIAILSVY